MGYPLNIALLGPSGVGKGTHAALLAARHQLRHVATGDLFRHNLLSHTALGILARKYMEQGELVPDEVVDAMVEEWGDRLTPEQGALFDGFPRTAYQVRFLEDLLSRLGRELDAAVYLKVSDAEIIRRLSGRLICRHCQTPYHQTANPPDKPGVCDLCGDALYHRPDDSTELVTARLRVFHRTTEPVLDYFAEINKLVIVPGEGSLAEVEARLTAVFADLAGKSAHFASRAELAAAAPTVAAGSRPPMGIRMRPTIDLVLLGGPGSGKGTQAVGLSSRLKLPHIATGDLFRENLRQATSLGQLAKTYMDRGELVPDDVTEAMVEERLDRPDAHGGFILDGFPRTLPQAQALTEMLLHRGRRLSGVLYINVPDELIVTRLGGRMICRNCQTPYHQLFQPPHKPGICDRCGGELYQRMDDNPDTIRTRLATFHRQTEPLIDYFRQTGLLHEIDGGGSVTQVADNALTALQRFAPIPAPAAPAAL